MFLRSDRKISELGLLLIMKAGSAPGKVISKKHLVSEEENNFKEINLTSR